METIEEHTNPDDQNHDNAPSTAMMLRITLQLDGNSAFTNTVGLSVVTALQEDERDRVEPVYTGQRGGSLLVDVVTVVAQTLTFAKDHHAVISESIQDLGGLVSIFSGVVPLCRHIVQAVTRHAHADETPAEAAATAPLKITVEIDGHTISVEAADLAQANAALVLARQFAATYPVAAKQASPTKSRVKTHAQITRPPRKKRRHGR